MDMINRYNYRSGIGIMMGMVFGTVIYLPLVFLVKNATFLAVGLGFGLLIGNSIEAYLKKKFESPNYLSSGDEVKFRLYTIVAISLALLSAILIFITNFR